jgi:hypothetical protein
MKVVELQERFGAENSEPVAPFWKRSHKPFYAVIVFATLLITLLEGYPWLSIQESGFLDPKNPYSLPFLVINEGYVPITDLDAECEINSTIGTVQFNNWRVGFAGFADYLAHEGSVTAPCFQSIELDGTNRPFIGVGPANRDVTESAALSMTIIYSFYHINLKWFRRSQSLRFKSIIGKDGAQHWLLVT